MHRVNKTRLIGGGSNIKYSGGDIKSKKRKTILLDAVILYLINNKKSIDSLSDENYDKLWMLSKFKKNELVCPCAVFVFESNGIPEHYLWINELNKHYLASSRFNNDMKIMKKFNNYKKNNKKYPKSFSKQLDDITIGYFIMFILPNIKNSKLQGTNKKIDVDKINMWIMHSSV